MAENTEDYTAIEDEPAAGDAPTLEVYGPPVPRLWPAGARAWTLDGAIDLGWKLTKLIAAYSLPLTIMLGLVFAVYTLQAYRVYLVCGR